VSTGKVSCNEIVSMMQLPLCMANIRSLTASTASTPATGSSGPAPPHHMRQSWPAAGAGGPDRGLPCSRVLADDVRWGLHIAAETQATGLTLAGSVSSWAIACVSADVCRLASTAISQNSQQPVSASRLLLGTTLLQDKYITTHAQQLTKVRTHPAADTLS